MSQQNAHSDDIANSWDAFVRSCEEEFGAEFYSGNGHASPEALNARLKEALVGDEKTHLRLKKSVSALGSFVQTVGGVVAKAATPVRNTACMRCAWFG